MSEIPYEARLRALREKNIKADPAYDLSMQLCNGNGEAFATVFDAAKNEALRLFTSPDKVIERGYHNGFIPPEVKELLDSEAFELAMATCKDRVAVMERIQTADYNGKFVGLAGVGAAYVGLRLGFGRLATAAQTSSVASGAVKTVYIAGFMGNLVILYNFANLIINRDSNRAKTQAEVDKAKNAIRENREQTNHNVLQTYIEELAQIELALTTPEKFSDPELAELNRRAAALRRVIERRRATLAAPALNPQR